MTPEQIILALRSADNRVAVAKAIDLRDELINTIYANAASPDRAETPYRQLAELQAELRKLERAKTEINDVLSDWHLRGDGCVRTVMRYVDRVALRNESLEMYHVVGGCIQNYGDVEYDDDDDAPDWEVDRHADNQNDYVIDHMETAREILVDIGWIEGVDALSTLSEDRIDPWDEGSEAEATDEDKE